MFIQSLYNSKYHSIDLSNYNFLITGGAGFIGSNIVEYLLKFGAGHVRVLDNLSNGYYENIKAYTSLSNFEFINGDIRDIEICRRAVNGIDFISHQAALGSVPRSISDPLLTNDVNISGFLNMMVAAKDSPSLKQFIYAASSSTYGDSKELPKTEGKEGSPLSPYAVSKLVNELYADVFSKVYNFHTVGLRYFNVFGPRQNPNNPYAAVIPLFCKRFLDSKQPDIYGDGKTTRDFTFVENAVQANIRVVQASMSKTPLRHEIFNVACGEEISLVSIVDRLNEITGKGVTPNYLNKRIGDIDRSLADIEKLKNYCGYLPAINFYRGLDITFSWYSENYKKDNCK